MSEVEDKPVDSNSDSWLTVKEVRRIANELDVPLLGTTKNARELIAWATEHRKNDPKFAEASPEQVVQMYRHKLDNEDRLKRNVKVRDLEGFASSMQEVINRLDRRINRLEEDSRTDEDIIRVLYEVVKTELGVPEERIDAIVEELALRKKEDEIENYRATSWLPVLVKKVSSAVEDAVDLPDEEFQELFDRQTQDLRDLRISSWNGMLSRASLSKMDLDKLMALLEEAVSRTTPQEVRDLLRNETGDSLDSKN